MKDSTFKKYCLVVDEWFTNGFNGVKAYQKFYPKASKVTAEGNFRKIHGNTRIQEYIKSKRKKLEDELDITLKRQLYELEELKSLSKGSRKYNDAINAIKEQNRLLGYYELDNLQLSAPTLAEMLAMSPEERMSRMLELKRQIAEQEKRKK